MARSRKFVLKVEVENAAFHDEQGNFEPGPEIVRILMRVANRIEREGDNDTAGRILDANGNLVGGWKYTGR